VQSVLEDSEQVWNALLAAVFNIIDLNEDNSPIYLFTYNKGFLRWRASRLLGLIVASHCRFGAQLGHRMMVAECTPIALLVMRTL